MNHSLLLASAGLLAGMMNAIAGGGSFVSFPALVAVGVPPVSANASSAVALFPGGVISAWMFRRGAGPIGGVPLRTLAGVTAVGGLVGALLLLATPAAAFDCVVPWLLLLATLALAFGRSAPVAGSTSRRGNIAVVAGQLVLGLYGGYFGGAAGIMMAAFWSIMAGCEAKSVQAQRTLLVTAANAVAVIFFSVAAAVRWGDVLILAPAALAGGYAGALIGLRLPPAHARFLTIAIAGAVTCVFFYRAYG